MRLGAPPSWRLLLTWERRHLGGIFWPGSAAILAASFWRLEAAAPFLAGWKPALPGKGLERILSSLLMLHIKMFLFNSGLKDRPRLLTKFSVSVKYDTIEMYFYLADRLLFNVIGL